MPFKDISYLELWHPLCSVEQNHSCNFDTKHHKEKFFDIILNLNHWFRRRCLLKDFLSRALMVLKFSRGEQFMQTKAKGIMGNNYTI